MSTIHQCKDGSQDITGRGTPGKVPCTNGGGKLFPLTPGERVAIDDYHDCPVGGGPINENDPCVLKLTGTFEEMTSDNRVKVRVDDYKGQPIIAYYQPQEIKKSLGMEPATPPPPPPPPVNGVKEEIIVEDIPETQTAGLSNNKILLYLVGAGILFYIGKKEKWF